MSKATSAPAQLWVRIYPLDKARGHVKKTMIINGIATAFSVDVPWYIVDARVAKQLKVFRNRPDDLSSPRVFQVVTEEEARKIDERSHARVMAAAKNPQKVTYGATPVEAIRPPVILPPATAATPELEDEAAEESESETPEGAEGTSLLDFDDAFEDPDDVEESADAPVANAGALTSTDLDPKKGPVPVAIAVSEPSKKKSVATPKPKKR